jgi:hypothetical protein
MNVRYEASTTFSRKEGEISGLEKQWKKQYVCTRWTIITLTLSHARLTQEKYINFGDQADTFLEVPHTI